MDFLSQLELSVKNKKIPLKYLSALKKFYHSYITAVTFSQISINKIQPTLLKFLELLEEQLKTPYAFEPFHQAMRKPFDYYQFGLDFIRPLIDFPNSSVIRPQVATDIKNQLKEGHNVILFANHQTEPDPQIISLLLEKTYPLLAEEMIFVAGHRVISDPMAIPFSMGRNLLCIFSKKYITHPPELKQMKLLHNQGTMKKMLFLLAEGGKCIYVAPSGGRDRPNAENIVEVAPFDPQSVEIFWLLAQQSKQKTHFYPLTLSTYNLLPPPTCIKKELGESRYTTCTPVHIAFGNEIDMENSKNWEGVDKKQKRQKRSEFIERLVKNDYESISHIKNK